MITYSKGLLGGRLLVNEQYVTSKSPLAFSFLMDKEEGRIMLKEEKQNKIKTTQTLIKTLKNGASVCSLHPNPVRQLSSSN